MDVEILKALRSWPSLGFRSFARILTVADNSALAMLVSLRDPGRRVPKMWPLPVKVPFFLGRGSF